MSGDVVRFRDSTLSSRTLPKVVNPVGLEMFHMNDITYVHHVDINKSLCIDIEPLL